MSRLVGRTKHVWNVAIDPIARGGEGEVYPVVFDDSHLVKVYHNPPGEAQVRKLKALVDIHHAIKNGASNRRLEMEALMGLSAWPIDYVTGEEDSKVIGYVMRKLEGHRQLSHLCNSLRRQNHFPNAGWDYVLHVAANLCRCVAAVHEAGAVIGDLNDRNFGVDEAGIVRMWDCDSIQLEHKGELHLCPVGDPMHTPPELHGAELATVRRTIQHDCYGLAVVLFSLITQGKHPFIGVKPGMGTDLQDMLARAIFVYGEDGMLDGWEPPIGSLWLSHLTPPIAVMFEKAFTAHRRGGTRPTAVEWIPVIEEMASSLESCGRGHYQVAGRECPWCHVAAETRHHEFEPRRDLIDEVAFAEGRLGPLSANLLRSPREIRVAIAAVEFVAPMPSLFTATEQPKPSDWTQWEISRLMAPVTSARNRYRRIAYFVRTPWILLFGLLAILNTSMALVLIAAIGFIPIGRKKMIESRRSAAAMLRQSSAKVSGWISSYRRMLDALSNQEYLQFLESERTRALTLLQNAEQALAKEYDPAHADLQRQFEKERTRRDSGMHEAANNAKGSAPLTKPFERPLADPLPLHERPAYKTELAFRKKHALDTLRVTHSDVVENALNQARLHEIARLEKKLRRVESAIEASHSQPQSIAASRATKDLVGHAKNITAKIAAYRQGAPLSGRRAERTIEHAVAHLLPSEADLMAKYSDDLPPSANPSGAPNIESIEAQLEIDFAPRFDKLAKEIAEAELKVARQLAPVVERLRASAEEHAARVYADVAEVERMSKLMPQATADVNALQFAASKLSA